MIMKIGPFTFYRVEETGTLDVTLTRWDNYPFGWEYGWADETTEPRTPYIDIRAGKLVLFFFEKWPRGFEIRLLGFWWIS